MKMSIEIDPARKRVLTRGEGRFDLRAIAQVMIDIANEPLFDPHFGTLVDLRAMEPGPPTLEEIEAINRLNETRHATSHSPIALLGRPGTLWDMLRLTAEQAVARGVKMRAFLHMDEADAWLIAESRDPSAAERERIRAFIAAVQRGDLDAVAEALATNAELADEPGEGGVSLVCIAAYWRHPEIVALLAEHRSILDIVEASAAGHIERVRFLCREDPLRANLSAPDGFFPLTLAAYFGHVEIVDELIESGADVNAVTENAMRVTAIHAGVAARKPEESVRIVRSLAAAGANLNAAQSGGVTALHDAALRGKSAVVEELLACGADRTRRSEEGRTALDYARDHGHAEILEILGR